jgi:hypothetical protein
MKASDRRRAVRRPVVRVLAMRLRFRRCRRQPLARPDVVNYRMPQCPVSGRTCGRALPHGGAALI